MSTKPKRGNGSKNPATRAYSKGGAKMPPTPKQLQKEKEREEKLNPGPQRVLCGAKTKKGGTCQQTAGFGTIHFGIGKCKWHGGSMRNHIKAAATEEYRQMLGTPMEINALDALIMCIKIRAGEVKWLGDRMAELDKDSWIEDTMIGKQFHLYARERQAAMRDLARYSQMAISLGIAERAVKLAETYGEMIAIYTRNILDDLWPHLTEEGKLKSQGIVRQHLIALDGGRVPVQPVAVLEAAAEEVA